MDFSDKRVLLVDDHQGIRGLFKIGLVNNEFKESNVLLAESGVAALALYDTEIAAKRTIDIIITDTDIPIPKSLKEEGVAEIHGPELMKMLRAKGYEGPIIQTSGVDRDTRHHGKMDMFILKDSSAVMEAIKSLLSQSPEPQKPSEPEAKKRILVVEDDSDLRMVVVGRLNANGYEVVEAEDGAKALSKVEALGKDYFDLVISDRNMPVMDGPNLLIALRKLGYANGFVAMSCGNRDFHKSAYPSQGADMYWDKVFDQKGDILGKFAEIIRNNNARGIENHGVSQQSPVVMEADDGWRLSL